MDIKKSMMLLLTATITTLLLSCQSCEDSCDQQRKFTYELSVLNLKDTYNIGEEIVFKLVVPDIVLEENTNELIDISDWDYLTDLSLFRINDDELISAYPMFEYTDSIGQFLIQKYSSSIWRVALGLTRNTDSRVFVGKFIPLEAGFFSFSITHLITDIVLPDCPNRFVNLHYNLNKGAENNYHLIESTAIREEITEEEMKQFGGFVFVVKE